MPIGSWMVITEPLPGVDCTCSDPFRRSTAARAASMPASVAFNPCKTCGSDAAQVGVAFASSARSKFFRSPMCLMAGSLSPAPSSVISTINLVVVCRACRWMVAVAGLPARTRCAGSSRLFSTTWRKMCLITSASSSQVCMSAVSSPPAITSFTSLERRRAMPCSMRGRRLKMLDSGSMPNAWMCTVRSRTSTLSCALLL